MGNISIIEGYTIEFHYCFNDNSHTMNAIIFNKYEYEFLGIIKEIAQKLKIEFEVDTEPLQEGGLRSWFKFSSNERSAFQVGVMLFLATNVLGTPLTTALEELTRMAIQSVFESDEVKQLKEQKQIAELKYDIADIEAEIEKLSRGIDENVIKKILSNYYESLNVCNKVNKVSVSITDSTKSNTYYQREVLKQDFANYIMTSDDAESDNDENAIIEIVSPVLKKGKYKWTGIYNAEVIAFRMKSNEFKTLVQIGQVQFKNGSSINCHLVTHKKINAEGKLYISSYEVILVNNYFENDKPIETPEGRRKCQKLEAEQQQLNLF